MNHMTEVAKMLGVEIGQEFKCNNGYKYILTENGIIESFHVGNRLVGVDNFSVILCRLLNGTMTIVPRPFKPNNEEIYWSVDRHGNASLNIWKGSSKDYMFYKVGNCYRTEAEAKVDCDKWAAFYASDDVLEVLNVK